MSLMASPSSTLVLCLCGKRHRPGTVCARGERIRTQQAHAAAVLAELRRLPVGTVAVLDTRGDRATARTLASATSYARRYADGCADTDWGEVATTADGVEVRYATDNGGFVPNGYGYRAEADWLYVAAADGRVAIHLSRGAVGSRPHGQGSQPDYLLSATAALNVVADGERYNAPWLVAVRAAARLVDLLRRRVERKHLDANDSVDLDRALELGWVESP